jgi:hypothetical protein
MSYQLLIKNGQTTLQEHNALGAIAEAKIWFGNPILMSLLELKYSRYNTKEKDVTHKQLDKLTVYKFNCMMGRLLIVDLSHLHLP